MKLSIVTPTYNSEKYLKDTIESVLSQAGDFDIEYIFADGGSSDGTLKIIEYYKDQIDTGRYKIYCNSIEIKYFSEKDFGMYDAINKGFNLATGEIYAWINSDDVYLQGAFQIICTTFGKFPEIKWLKGITSFIKDDDLSIFKKGVPYIYSQDWITRGIYGRDTYFIQQDSVFWRKELWTMSGGANSKLKLAGDYDLWIRFAKHVQRGA
jgi:glycosyltransferase involved in cell wall biosynthesis